MADLSQIYAQQNAQTLGTLNFMQGVKQFQYKQQKDAVDLGLRLKEDLRATEKHASEMSKAQREQAAAQAEDFSKAVTWVDEAPTKIEKAQRLNQAIDFYTRQYPDKAQEFEQYRGRTDMIPLLLRHGRKVEDILKAPEKVTLNKGDQEVTRLYKDGKVVDEATAPRWQPDKPSAVTIRTPDGEVLGGQERDGKLYVQRGNEMVPAPAGSFKTSVSVQGTTLDALGIGKKASEEASQKAFGYAAGVSEGLNFLQDVRKNEGAFGVRGAATEALGGLAGNIPGQMGENLEESITAAGTGMSPEKLTEMRTRGRTFVAARMRSISGDESGRYSDQDRQRVENALKTLDPTASPRQVASAVQTVIGIERVAEERSRLMAGKIKPQTDDAYFNQIGNEMLQQGMDEAGVELMLRELYGLHSAAARMYGGGQ